MTKTDILVIGTGIAGLSFAIKTARKRPDLSIVLMTKSSAETSNTQFAQGGIAVVTNKLKDSFEAHIQDTLKAGGGKCDKAVVRMVVQQAPKRLRELMADGVQFDKNRKSLDLALEGGHSQHRIVHRADSTGKEIENQLLQTVQKLPNIHILEHHFVVDLIVNDSNNERQCTGILYFDDHGQLRHLRSRITVLSTGGSGQIFGHTTNAAVATGDGVAMAARAKADISDMDYFQFHPTALAEPGKNPHFLLSEALRGFGAHIVNAQGKRFLFKYDIRGELATREVISKAIMQESSVPGNSVYLDCRHLNPADLRARFPTIVAYCESVGMDPCLTRLPIVPVAHYQCGGISVNSHAQTSIKALFAIGECSRTGMHGNNRLASNSLLEAVVFAHQAAEKAVEIVNDIAFSTTVYVNTKGASVRKTPSAQIRFEQIKKRLQSLMDRFYNEENGDMAQSEIQLLREICVDGSENAIHPAQVETLNMLDVAQLIVTETQSRKGLSAVTR